MLLHYSEQASGIIISSTNICFSYIDVFSGWQMTTNVDDSTGILTFIARNCVSHIKFPTFMKINLWYHHLHVHDVPKTQNSTPCLSSIVQSLTYHATYELWHHRLVHQGKSIAKKFRK